MASSQRPAAGFSLLEVLVSIVVLSVGLLGAVGMLTTAVRSTGESAAFSAAIDLVRDLSEKTRINRTLAAKRGDGNPYLLELGPGDTAPAPTVACAGTASCTPAQLAAWDLREWAARVRAALPDARLTVCFDEGVWRDDASAWACHAAGAQLVVKLGWAPRIGTAAEHDAGHRPPRVVMPLGQARDDGGHVPVGF